MTRKRRSPTNSASTDAHTIEAMLEADLFRSVRTDTQLRSLERRLVHSHPAPHAYLLHALLGAGSELSESRAARIWSAIVVHRRSISNVISRTFPLRAAAIDWLYLEGEDDRPISPVVVSRRLLSSTIDAARRDGLTGLLTGKAFEAELTRRLREPSFVGGAIAYIDLDGFKLANDRRGHAHGDSVLRELGRVTVASIRATDLAARLGGDEFAVFLEATTPAHARTMVARVRAAFEERCSLSFSFGVASIERGEHVGDALSRADRAMYRQKRTRRRS